MTIYNGKTVVKGIAIGKGVTLKSLVSKSYIDKVLSYPIEDAQIELKRLYKAVEIGKKEITWLKNNAINKVGSDAGDIFETHEMLIDDQGFLEAVCELITDGKNNAEYAVSIIRDRYVERFLHMPDETLKARSADIKDVSNRIIRILTKEENKSEVIGQDMQPVSSNSNILISDDLLPSELMALDGKSIAGIVLIKGTIYSHVAILAGIMGIPMVVDITLEEDQSKTITDKDVPQLNEDEQCGEVDIILDASAGTIMLNPSNEDILRAQRRLEMEVNKKDSLHKYRGLQTITSSGKEIKLLANIGSVEDARTAVENDAEGIGLFRTEFIYMNRDSAPSEEEQYEIYKSVMDIVGEGPVIFRTMDIGADKEVPYLHFGNGKDCETNPAIGYRGIRMGLDNKELLITQLRAIMRASAASSASGKVYIMYPMVSSLEEVRGAMDISNGVLCKLREEGYAVKPPKQGIMVETPAAVMLTDKLAQMVDFFSIGTNDLSQFIYACDRTNPRVNGLLNGDKTALMSMIQLTIDNAHKHGKWVDICGELAGDTSVTQTLIEMGIDGLSVASGKILELRGIIRGDVE